MIASPLMATRKKAKRSRTTSPLKKPRADGTVRASTARKPLGERRPRASTRKLTSAATPAPPPEFKKVAFILLPVSDPQRARAFYEQTLGLKRGMGSENGIWTEYDLPMGGCVALFCHPSPAMAMKPGGATVAFEVADLDALGERLKAAGVTFMGPIVHGPHCRMWNLQDSEGNSLMLHQLNPK